MDVLKQIQELLIGTTMIVEIYHSHFVIYDQGESNEVYESDDIDEIISYLSNPANFSGEEK